MAPKTEKKRSLEEYLFQQQPSREEYVTAGTEDGKVQSKSKTSKMTYDPKTRKSEVESGAINVDAEPREEAQAPRLKDKILPPLEEAPAEAPDMLPKYAPREVASVAPRKEIEPTGPSGWERFLVGATPALVGLLSGNQLEGFQISGKHLVDTEADLYKRERDFNGKIAEMKAKRDMGIGEKGVKPSYARQEMYDPRTKKTYIHSIVNDQDAGILGEASPDKVKESYMKEVMYNPETKQMEVATINPRTKEVSFHGVADSKNRTSLADLDFQGESTKALVDMNSGDVVKYVGKNPEKKSPLMQVEEGRQKRFADQKTLDAFKTFSNGNSKFNKMQENLDGLVMAADQLNLGNPRANAGLQNYLARNVYGEKGPLSDQDISRLSGDPSYSALIDRFLDARLSGKLGEMDRADIRQILDLAYMVQVQKMMNEAETFGQGYKALGYDPTPGIQAYLNGKIRPLPGHKALGRGHRSHPEGPKVGTVENGHKFKGGDPTKRENWEKQ